MLCSTPQWSFYLTKLHISSDMPTIYLSYILGITPVFKRGSQSDPTCYHLIGALPSLSQVFEQLLVLQLWLHIDPYIPHEQFSFIRGPSSLVAGVSLAFTITTAINQYAEAMDIKGAFDSVCWKGLVAHLWSIGFQDKVFRAFESYVFLSNRYIRVVTPSGYSDLHFVTAGVPQGTVWSPALFNLYIRLLPTVIKHSLIVGYADDHSLLKIISDKTDLTAAASDLNYDLASLCHFGLTWHITFAPNKPSSLLISLKRNL